VETFSNTKNKTTYMLFSKYLKSIAWLSLLSLMVIAIINFTVDPGRIYPSLLTPDKYGKSSPRELVEQLIQSDYGVYLPDNIWNIRDIKHELALHSTSAQCAVIGSSHIMQISSIGEQTSLPGNCSTLINLGVSGASLEDYLALSETLLQNKNPPKIIAFGIDPWALNFNRDVRWKRYSQKYLTIRTKLLGGSSDNPPDTRLEPLRNLINREYFLRSMSLIGSERNKSIELVSEFDPQMRLKHPVILPDGSLFYAAKNIGEVTPDTISGINDYKIINDQWFHEEAVELFILLVNFLQQQEFKIIFTLTPYHPKVWSFMDQSVVSAMKAVELKIHEIAKATGAQVIGSYHPGKIGCKADEFNDSMHVVKTCLNKLESLSISYQ
jgi:hypothetical protein